MLDTLTVEDFQKRLNDVFRLDLAEGAIDLELTEAEPTGAAPSDEQRRRPFSLIFTGPETPVLPQQIHPLAHPDMGEFSIFLVPIGPGDGGMRYQAIFN